MDKFKEAATLFRALADLFDDMEPDAESEAIVWARKFGREATASAERFKEKTKWVTYRLELAQPIGKPKAGRILDRLATSPNYRDQLSIVMGQGTASRQAVVAFNVRITDKNGDGLEIANFMANKMNERGSDPRARAKVSSVAKAD